jgi:hypothetical protein
VTEAARDVGRHRGRIGARSHLVDQQLAFIARHRRQIAALAPSGIPRLATLPFLGAAAFSISYSGKDRHRKDVTVQQWTFSIQQEIARDTMLQVGYLGTKGTHLFRKGLALNGIDPITGKRPYASLTNSTIGWTTDDANNSLQALQVRYNR